MGVVNTKSLQITNSDSTSLILNDLRTSGAMVREAVDTVAKAAADSNASVYRFFRVQSNWRISEIMIWNDAITGGISYGCGLYRVAREGGSAVSASLFASTADLSVSTAILGMGLYLPGITTVRQRVWELLGLASDPQISYDICLTANTAGGGAGNFTMRLRYASN